MLRLAPTAFALLLAPAAVAQGYEAATERLVDATSALFDELEAESADRAAPRFARSLRAPEPIVFHTANEALRPELGPIEGLTGYRVTWYEAGTLLGAVDFVGTWGRGGHLVCGYVVWDMGDGTMSEGNAPTLDRIEAAYLETGGLLAAGDDAAHAALLEANCAYGEIEANFQLVRQD